MKLLLTTKNVDKIKEMKALLKNYDLVTLAELDDQDVVIESGQTFHENALIKAKYYGDKYQMLALADDSGLEVFSLNNEPGVYSNRYGKTPQLANKRLIEAVKDKDKKARFVTVLCLYNPFDGTSKYYEGILRGSIILTPRGENGFGYDPIFLLDSNQTLGELSLEEKSKISHRANALNKLRGDLWKF